MTKIETERLILTRPTIADFDESFAMNSDSTLLTYIGSGKPPTRQETWFKLLRNIGHWEAFGHGIFTVREKAENGYVGEIGLARFARGLGDAFDAFPEAALILSAKTHGRGYATEALQAALDWIEKARDVRRTVCIIHPENAPSLRVAQKLGYVRIGESEYSGSPTIMFQRCDRLTAP